MRTRQRMVYAVAGMFSLLLVGGAIVFFQFTDVKDAHAAATGDYQTRGPGNWNGTTTWQRYNGSSWVNVTTSPSSSDGVITILSGHTVTVTTPVTVDQLTVSAGGQLIQNTGITLTIANGSGTDLTVNGTFQSGGTINLSGGPSISFGSTGVYNHNQNGGTIPTATWNATSHCRIIGVTNTFPNGANQSFGHVTFNSPLVTDVEINTNLNMAGNFNVSGTGSRTLFLTNSSNNRSITIGSHFNDSAGTFVAVNNSGTSSIVVAGNFNLSGGNFNLKDGNGISALQVSGAMNINSGTFNVRRTSTVNTATVTVSGNFSMIGGTLDLSGVAAVGTLNVGRDFSHTGGTITESSTGSGAIVFTRSGTQTFTGGGTVSNTINYTVNSGSTLALGTQLLGNGSNGTFTLSSGAGLSIGDPDGISTSGATGNVRVSGTRSFHTGASYTYSGSAAQQSGTGLPTTVANLTINNASGMTLNNSTAVSNTLTLTSGDIFTGSNELRVTNTAAGAITGHSQSSYVVGNLRRSITGSGTFAFPIGTAAEYELASVTLTGITGTTSILATFTNAAPLTPANPLTSLMLRGSDIVDMLNYGYWTLTPNTPATGGTFSITLNQRGFTNSSGNKSYTVLGRINSDANWQTPGAVGSGNLSGGTVTASRSALTTFYDFGIGIAENPIPMVFTNDSLISGTAGQVGATYLFRNVTTGVDAWITIMDIDGNAYLSDIDNFDGSNGYNIAWQPFVNAAGNDTSSIGWRIRFKKASTSTDTTLQNVAITGIDIDGNTQLREFVEATRPYSYSLGTVTTLTVTELDTSYRAIGDFGTISNIDTSRTEAMFQINYSNINSFYYRTGGISTKSSDEVRQHALMFNSTLTNNASTNSALPISLMYFTPTAKDDHVELHWVTASEVNNAYFTVERSTDGVHFEEILSKQGNGNSTTPIAYADIDYSPHEGLNYYRLKQVDYDGQSEYFPIKVVKFGKTESSGQHLSIQGSGPNPFTTDFRIHYQTDKPGEMEILILSMAGQIVYNQKIQAVMGINTFSFEQGNELAAGIYIVRMTLHGEVLSTKLKKE